MSQTVRSSGRRNTVDYKKLHAGDVLPRKILNKSRVVPKNVLPGTYTVERIISQKKTPEGKLYLIKWDGFHRQESTWEPESHLTEELTKTFLCPPVDLNRLQAAAEIFERAVQQRLSTKSSYVSIEFNLDIYRHIFCSNESVLIYSENELKKLPVCANWSYKMKRNGDGICVFFPMRITPRLYMRPIYVKKQDGIFSKMLLPIEKIDIVCAVKPYRSV